MSAQSVSQIFSEIMADPEPVVGLPKAEYVELNNAGSEPIDLNGWVFSDRSTSVELRDHVLMPGEFLLLCSVGDTSILSSFGKVCGLDPWPRLNNESDDLTLFDRFGRIRDQLSYDRSWYGDGTRDDGGYSLEVVDPHTLCNGISNWRASLSESGGTPGVKNSHKKEVDVIPPVPESAWLSDSSRLNILFNESISTLDLSNIDLELTGNLVTDTVYHQNSRTLIVLFNGEMVKNQREKIRIGNVRDCKGNLLIEPVTLCFVLPDEADFGDVVINEILFNPYPSGVDFVEFYNRSEKYLDLKGWEIGNYQDSIINLHSLSDSNFIFRPEEYLVLTKDPNNIRDNYPASFKSHFIVTELPGFSNESGTVGIRDGRGKIIDHMHYHEDQHFSILRDHEGVSLERIDPWEDSSNPDNWRSASETENFATPGYRNSQLMLHEEGKSQISVVPKIITPDSDGIDDFTRINYRFEQPGFIGNIMLYDPNGREIKQLANNVLMGTQGFFQWDGTDNQGRKARTGYYLIHFQFFDHQGNTKIWRNGVVVGIGF